MAWQQHSALNNGGAGGNGEGNGPTGTEYTLQGVMRFLQIEWHSHERARNAWDIERAEMKAKIAKQEGEMRKLKQLNDQLDKQIRMLERVLKNERAKKSGATEDKASVEDLKKDLKGKGAVKAVDQRPPNKPHNSFLDIEEPADPSEAEKEAQKDRSKMFLSKCVEELTYLLTPPTHPPPPQPSLQSLANSAAFMDQRQQPFPMEDVYMQRQNNQQVVNKNSREGGILSNHNQAIPTSLELANQAQQQATIMERERSNHQQGPLPSIETIPPSMNNVPLFQQEEPVERITHSFDSYGKPVEPRDEEGSASKQLISDGPDDWNFEEAPSIPAPAAPDLPPPKRPDSELFPSAHNIPTRSPPRAGPGSHRRKSSGSIAMARRKSAESHEAREREEAAARDAQNFKVRFALRGHLDVVRSVIFTGGGSPSEPEVCTAGDDGTIKRWYIPTTYTSMYGQHAGSDIDIQSYFTHRGHEGIVTSLAACPAHSSFSTGGRSLGDGWIFSGGQDTTIKVWERGRVDPKATLNGHTDAIWTVCVLPGSCGSVFDQDSSVYGGADRILLASGSSDGTIKVWAVSAPPQTASPQTGSRRGVGGSRRHSVTSGSNFPSSPQPSIATSTPFHYTLIHSIERAGGASPTCIAPLGPSGETFVVSYTDASVIIYDTRTGEEIIGMASNETYDGTTATSVNAVVATTVGLEGGMSEGRMGPSVNVGGEEDSMAPTGTSGGVEGVIISGHEDRYIRFFDANSGQCTYSMLAHPSSISSLSLSPDGREAVSAGHDASIRFWSLEKRICTQEITSHRTLRGEGVCAVVWSQDGRHVVSAGGDGVVKVFSR